MKQLIHQRDVVFLGDMNWQSNSTFLVSKTWIGGVYIVVTQGTVSVKMGVSEIDICYSGRIGVSGS